VGRASVGWVERLAKPISFENAINGIPSLHPSYAPNVEVAGIEIAKMEHYRRSRLAVRAFSSTNRRLASAVVQIY